MRERGVFAKTAKDSALYTEISERGRTVIREFALRHSVPHRGPGGPISNQRKVVGLLHQRDFRPRLVHPATSGHRRGADKSQSRCCLTNAVKEKEADPLFDSNAAGDYASIAKDLGHATVRALVLFPRANVLAKFDQLAGALFFKFGTNPGEFAALRNYQRQHALAGAPAHAGVVEHA